MSLLKKYKNGYWIGGTLAALSGAFVARFVGPGMSEEKLRPVVTVLGQALALAGLFVIMLGVRKRLRRANEALAREQDKPESTKDLPNERT